MKAITLRNLPQDLAHRIEQESKLRGLSLSKTIIRLLEEYLLHKQEVGKDVVELYHFAGTWTSEEADEFDRNLTELRKIDTENFRDDCDSPTK